jgi:aspartate/methionine/tyrosine aminotransferase
LEFTSWLTEHEQAVTRLQLLDLAVGYPRLAGPEWLATLRDAYSTRELQAAYQSLFRYPSARSREWTPSPALLEANLTAAVLDFLSLPASLTKNCFLTHSGSAALERALAVAVPPSGTVRLPAPIFDVIPGFLRERSARFQWWELDWTRPDWTRAGSALTGTKATILVTPDNPSGATASGAALATLAADADRARCNLVVDQSLGLLSRDGRRAPLLADFADRRSAWIMLWDTGKTLDLNGDKIGVMIVGDPLKERVRAALRLVQYSLPHRLMMLMTLVLVMATQRHYLGWLAARRRDNEHILANFGHDWPVNVRIPEFGAFSLVDSPATDSESLVGLAAQRGLGLISTSSFTHGTLLHDRADPLLRIPLLRQPDMMRESLVRLSSLLASEAICERQ